MNNALAIKDNLQGMSAFDKQSLILSYAAAMGREIEQHGIVKKLLYADDNGYPLSLAVTGGLNIIGNGSVEVEAKPLKHRIANDKNYHLMHIETTATRNEKHIFRRASDLWPFMLYDENAVIGDWVKVGESIFTMEDAKKIIINGKSLVDKDTYNNYPARMLEYRNTMRIVSLYGDGLFTSPTYYAGEISNGGIVQDDIIEGVEVDPPPTFPELAKTYGHDAVVAGMQIEGNDDLFILREWLEENKKDDNNTGQ